MILEVRLFLLKIERRMVPGILTDLRSVNRVAEKLKVLLLDRSERNVTTREEHGTWHSSDELPVRVFWLAFFRPFERGFDYVANITVKDIAMASVHVLDSTWEPVEDRLDALD